jgi:hypothetical protein
LNSKIGDHLPPLSIEGTGTIQWLEITPLMLFWALIIIDPSDIPKGVGLARFIYTSNQRHF